MPLSTDSPSPTYAIIAYLQNMDVLSRAPNDEDDNELEADDNAFAALLGQMRAMKGSHPCSVLGLFSWRVLCIGYCVTCIWQALVGDELCYEGYLAVDARFECPF